MACTIETGRFAKRRVELDPNVLFDSHSSDVVSNIFGIDPCKPVKLCFFGLKPGKKIELHKVKPKPGVMPQGSGCLCSTMPGTPTTIELSEEFKVAGTPVEFTDENSVMFLTVPGFFMLKLGSEDMLGKVYVEISEVECCCLPEKLVVGN